MNSKRIWLMIPAAMNPYMFLIGVFGVYVAPNFKFITESQFLVAYGFFIWIGLFLLLGLAAIGVTVVCFVLSITKKWEPVSLAKTAMIIKLIQIPAYIVIFILGLIFSVTVWLYVLSLFMIVVDYITLLMSSSLNIADVINAIREKKTTFKKSILIIISQFFFCVDVVGAIVFYSRLKKANRIEAQEIDEDPV